MSGSEFGADSPSESAASCASARNLDSMQPRVTAILVAHGGGEYLERTLASLSRQTRRPNVTIVIDTAPTDASNRTIAAAGPTLHLTARPGATFGAAVAQALTHGSDTDASSEWLWLLG